MLCGCHLRALNHNMVDVKAEDNDCATERRSSRAIEAQTFRCLTTDTIVVAGDDLPVDVNIETMGRHSKSSRNGQHVKVVCDLLTHDEVDENSMRVPKDKCVSTVTLRHRLTFAIGWVR